VYKQTEGLAMGAPTSSIFSEIYLQDLEHTTILDILIHFKLVGYFRYIDDILLIHDMQQTNICEVLDCFEINRKLQFTLEEEENNALHFLDIRISRTDNNIQFSIYQKPMTTDTIIPYDSCHPTEHKLSAFRYLHNRNATYLLTSDNKQKETMIINHILQTNKYNTSFGTDATEQ
jgi:hypothetical protein